MYNWTLPFLVKFAWYINQLYPSEALTHHYLGPKKQCIGNMCRGSTVGEFSKLAYVKLKIKYSLNTHISVISLHIFEISSKAMVQNYL